MKYYIEFSYSDPNKAIRFPKYNVYFKRHWWSKREVVAKGVEKEGGTLAIKDDIIIPHLIKMCKYDFVNLSSPQYNATDLEL
jgi:hypothetical protein